MAAMKKIDTAQEGERLEELPPLELLPIAERLPIAAAVVLAHSFMLIRRKDRLRTRYQHVKWSTHGGAR